MTEEPANVEASEKSDISVEDNDLDDATESTGEKPRRTGNAVAWLALLVSLAAVAIVGYGEFSEWRNDDIRPDHGTDIGDNRTSIAALRRDLDASQKRLGDVSNQVATLPAEDLSDRIETLQNDMERQLRLLNTVPSRMTSLEGSVASLAGISAGARQTFLLAEAEYYLQIANAQLQLANNPQLATLALGMADERVTQLSDPALIDVRRTIADELAALELMDKPDLAGVTLTLASLARVVESLPITSPSQGTATTDAANSDEQGNAAKAWSSVKDAMSGLVKVTPPEQAKLQLLSPDVEYFLRNNIAMQLQAARLALLRGEQTLFEQALDDAGALLKTYFDTESAQVISAQQTLAEIRTDVSTTAIPDISNSLRLLRQYRSLSETSQ